MLNQNLQEEPASTSTAPSNAAADNVRVTTEEFVSAINRIDARRAQEMKQINGTVAIGQTLRDLHVDANAEEVLREIEQMRREVALDDPGIVPEKPVQEQIAEAVAASELVAAKKNLRSRRRRLWLTGLVAFGCFLTGGLVQYSTDQHNGVQVQRDAELRSLSGLKDGQEVFLEPDALQKLMTGNGDVGVVNSISGNVTVGDGYLWPVVKKAGNYYVYAYVAPTEAGGATGAKKLFAYDAGNQPRSGQTLDAVPVIGQAVLSSSSGDGVDALVVTSATAASHSHL